MNTVEEFREHLMDLERSENTIDNYCRSVKIFFERYKATSSDGQKIWSQTGSSIRTFFPVPVCNRISETKQ